MSDNPIKLQVLTPEKELFAGEVSGVLLPGTMGSFEILKNHAPIISALCEGSIRINREGDKPVIIKASSGFVEGVDNQVSVLVEGGTVAE